MMKKVSKNIDCCDRKMKENTGSTYFSALSAWVKFWVTGPITIEKRKEITNGVSYILYYFKLKCNDIEFALRVLVYCTLFEIFSSLYIPTLSYVCMLMPEKLLLNRLTHAANFLNHWPRICINCIGNWYTTYTNHTY